MRRFVSILFVSIRSQHRRTGTRPHLHGPFVEVWLVASRTNSCESVPNLSHFGILDARFKQLIIAIGREKRRRNANKDLPDRQLMFRNKVTLATKLTFQ